MSRVVVVSGNPRPASRTQRLGELVGARVSAGVGGDVEVLDLSRPCSTSSGPAPPRPP